MAVLQWRCLFYPAITRDNSKLILNPKLHFTAINRGATMAVLQSRCLFYPAITRDNPTLTLTLTLTLKLPLFPQKTIFKKKSYFRFVNQTQSEKLLWYVLYTAPRAEKKVQIELQKKGFKTFLPVQRTLKQWSDRKKWIEEPLFKSYIFIETELEKNYYDILNTNGIVKFINFEKKPVVVNYREIETIQLLLGYTDGIEATDEVFEIGQKVDVIAGPLLGLNGLLVQKNGSHQFLMELETIHQKILINIPSNFLRIVTE